MTDGGGGALTSERFHSIYRYFFRIRHSSFVIQYFQFHEILLAERKGASSKWFVSTYQIKEGPDAFKKPSYHIEP